MDEKQQGRFKMLLFMDHELNDALTAQAERERRAKVEIVRYAIKQYIETHKPQNTAAV